MKRILILTLFISSEIMGQDISRIYKADTIYFYGYDFSHAMVNTKHSINEHVFPWIMHTTDKMPPSYFEKKMHMNVIHDFAHTNNINIKFIEDPIWRNKSNIKEEKKINSGYPLLFNNNSTETKNLNRHRKELKKEIPKKLIEKFLSQYSINQESGIGLVSFIAEINKEKESTLLHFIFFDIKNREIISIYNSHLEGASGIGMYNHWKHNFTESVYRFLKTYNEDLYFDYRSEYKRKKKRMRKWKY